MGSGGRHRSLTPLLAHMDDQCWASCQGITYSLVRHHNNRQNSSDNNVMPLKPCNINTIIAGNVANIYKGDKGMQSNRDDPNAEHGHASIAISGKKHNQHVR